MYWSKNIAKKKRPPGSLIRLFGLWILDIGYPSQLEVFWAMHLLNCLNLRFFSEIPPGEIQVLKSTL